MDKKQLLNNLREIYEIIFEATKDKLKYNQENLQHYYGTYIYSNIIENCYACIRLIEEELGATIQIILRNLLEATVDLKNLSIDKSYVYIIKVLFLNQKITLLINAKEEKGNEYLEKLNKQHGDEIGNIIDERNRYISMIKAHKYKIQNKGFISIKERFDKADATEIYDSIYIYLCGATHNNLNSLIQNHRSKDNKTTVFKSILDKDFVFYCDTLSGILTSALTSIYKILSIEEDSRLRKVKELREKSKQIVKYLKNNKVR